VENRALQKIEIRMNDELKNRYFWQKLLVFLDADEEVTSKHLAVLMWI
jgi:hypothetical protein